jgi:hypothetical protein
VRYLREPRQDAAPVDRTTLDDLTFWKSSGVEIETFTYFVQAEAGGPVKIGVAKDPAARLCLLQTGNPQRLVIRRVWPLDCERYLHRRHGSHRLTGEWFSDAAVVLEEAERCALWLREDSARVDHRAVLEFFGDHWTYAPVDPVDWAKGRNNPEVVALHWRDGWRIDQIARKLKLDEGLVAETVAQLESEAA